MSAGGGHGQADQFAAALGHLLDLGDAAIDVPREDIGHALNGDGRITANGDRADINLTCGATCDCQNVIFHRHFPNDSIVGKVMAVKGRELPRVRRHCWLVWWSARSYSIFLGSISMRDEGEIRVGTMLGRIIGDWVCWGRACIVMAGLSILAGCAEQGFTARWQRPTGLAGLRGAGVDGAVVLRAGHFSSGADNRYGLYVREYLAEQLSARQADRAARGVVGSSGGGSELPVEGQVNVTDVSGGVSGERVRVEVVFDLLTVVSDGQRAHSVRLVEFVEAADETSVGKVAVKPAVRQVNSTTGLPRRVGRRLMSLSGGCIRMTRKWRRLWRGGGLGMIIGGACWPGGEIMPARW